MSLTIQSLRSSSKGNCLLISTGRTKVLIDCGIKTQRECRKLLDPHAESLDAVLVSHAHGDHICYSGLRVLHDYCTPVLCHLSTAEHVTRKHLTDWEEPPALRCFGDDAFTVGDIEITPVPLPHEPWCPTYGFVLKAGGRTIVTCTDFFDPTAIAKHLVDADFIFLEANHDLELLRLFPNYASRFHLNNRKTANLLADVIKAGRKPQAVMLGHLSEQRNSEALATAAVRERFALEKLTIDFRLECAPRYDVSAMVEIA